MRCPDEAGRGGNAPAYFGELRGIATTKSRLGHSPRHQGAARKNGECLFFILLWTVFLSGLNRRFVMAITVSRRTGS
jgi:hypothetical protein